MTAIWASGALATDDNSCGAASGADGAGDAPAPGLVGLATCDGVGTGDGEPLRAAIGIAIGGGEVAFEATNR